MKTAGARFVLILFIVIFGCESASAQAACNSQSLFVEKACAGDDVNADERALFDLVSKYRAANSLSQVKISPQLSIVANRRMLDLRLNLKGLSHSWSNCPYDIRDEKTWPCVISAPRRLGTSYKGDGYETLYRTSTGLARPSAALDAWKKSSLHNSIILNQTMFKDIEWDELGVAVDGQFAALWFGTTKNSKVGRLEAEGLGVTYQQAVNGLTKLLPMKAASSTIEGGKWEGSSADKKIKAEIYGEPSEVSEANIRISLKLESDGKLSVRNFGILSTLLGNLLPTWTERNRWLESALKTVAADRTASRTQRLQKIAVEMSSGPQNSLELTVRPLSKVTAVEIN